MPKATVSTQNSLPDVGSLISQSWTNLMRNAGTMVMVWVIGVLAYILMGFVTAMALVVTGVIAHVSGDTFQNFWQNVGANPTMLLPVVGGIGVFIGVIVVLFAVLGSVLEASVIYAAAQSQTKISVGEAITKGKSRGLRLLGVGLVSGLLTFGGLFLFLIPGLVIGILFSMAAYEVVLGNEGVFNSIAISAGLVKKHFWDVLGRILILIGLAIVGMVVLGLVRGALTVSLGKGGALLVDALLRLVWNIGFSLFAIVYSTTLYKQLKAAGSAQPMSLMWVVIVSVIGWLIAGSIFATAAKAVGKAMQNWPAIMNQVEQNSQNQDDQQNFNNMMQNWQNGSPLPSPMMSPWATPTASGFRGAMMRKPAVTNTN